MLCADQMVQQNNGFSIEHSVIAVMVTPTSLQRSSTAVSGQNALDLPVSRYNGAKDVIGATKKRVCQFRVSPGLDVAYVFALHSKVELYC